MSASAKHVLVTGGAGYIGSHACKALARAAELAPSSTIAESRRLGHMEFSLLDLPVNGLGNYRPLTILQKGL
jgi:nucleoside-diphosphate-sugar epimerase